MNHKLCINKYSTCIVKSRSALKMFGRAQDKEWRQVAASHMSMVCAALTP